MFILPYTINNNKLSIKTSSLINTRVNEYTFINSKFIKIIEYILNIKLILLKLPYNIRGFNNK